MRYLPILQELFESDTVVFLIIGLVISIVAGKMAGLLLNIRKIIIILASSFILYIVCELLVNIFRNFMTELILLFLGTFSMGCFLGCVILLLIHLIRKKG